MELLIASQNIFPCYDCEVSCRQQSCISSCHIYEANISSIVAFSETPKIEEHAELKLNDYIWLYFLGCSYRQIISPVEWREILVLISQLQGLLVPYRWYSTIRKYSIAVRFWLTMYRSSKIAYIHSKSIEREFLEREYDSLSISNFWCVKVTSCSMPASGKSNFQQSKVVVAPLAMAFNLGSCVMRL